MRQQMRTRPCQSGESRDDAYGARGYTCEVDERYEMENAMGARGSTEVPVTRRGALAAFGAGLAATAGLAGCSDENEDTNSSAAGSTSTRRASGEDEGSEDTASEETSTAVPTLHVEGAKLVDEDGEAVQLRGISTHGLAWYPEYVNEECFDELHDEWDANVVRLALYTAESGGWCTDGDRDELRVVMNEGVEAAVENDMYVIIDWHILSDGDPNTYIDEACAFFEEMSEEHADAPNVIYEICNEPNGTTTWDDVKEYAETVIPVIRANAPDAVILVGTPNWSQYVDQAAEDPIEGYDNLMYTLHFYAATHTDDLRQTLKDAVEGGLPVFVSEYGICDASGSGSIDADSADEWVELMDELGVSYVAWNLSNKDETSAIVKSSCTKTSGFSADDLSESGLWVHDMLTGGDWTGSAGDDDEDADTDEASDGLTCTWAQGSTWESEGSQYALFTLTVENGADEAVTSWKAVVTFGQEVELSDSWNGSYTVAGDTLTVENASYNGEIDAGDSAADIGFIVYADELPEIESVTVSET